MSAIDTAKMIKDIKISDYSSITLDKALFIDIGQTMRLYYLPDKDIGNGFEFCSVEYIADYDFKTKPKWHDETLVEIFYQGIAFWDGIRHLYLGDDATDNYGYSYYPRLSDHISVLKTLQFLEEKYCKEFKR